MAKKQDLELRIKAMDAASPVLGRVAKALERLDAATSGSLRHQQVERVGKAWEALQKGPLGKLGAALGNVGTALGTTVQRFAGLAAVGGGALVALVHSSIEAGDKLSEVSQRVGLSANAYSALQFSAAQADVEQEAFTSGLDKFSKSLGEAKAGGGALLEFLKKVSPALATQFQGSKNVAEGMSLMAGAFEKLEDPSKRAALSGAAFGKTNLQMGEWLHQGTEEIRKQTKAYLTAAGDQQKFADAAGRLDNLMRDLAPHVTRVRNALLVGLAPALERLAARLADVLARNGPKFEAWIGRVGDAITKWVEGGGIERVVETLGNLADFAGKLAEALGPLGTALLVTTPLWAPLGVALLGVVPAAIAASAALGPVGAAIAAVSAAIVVLVPLLAKLESFQTLDKVLSATGAPGHEFPGQVGTVRPGETPEDAARRLGGTYVGSGAYPGQVGELRPGETIDQAARRLNMTPPSSSGTATAKVQIDFANAPKGTRVTPDRSSDVEIDYSLGFSMVAP